MADFEFAVIKTIRREGGDKLTDDQADPGGLTRYGISKRAHPEVDPHNLSLEGAKAIYHNEYWNPLQADSIVSQPIAETLFDSAVNMGVEQAVKLAQVVLGQQADGNLGPTTLAALNEADTKEFQAAYLIAKMARYLTIIKKNPVLKKYLYGWAVRAFEVGGV